MEHSEAIDGDEDPARWTDGLSEVEVCEVGGDWGEEPAGGFDDQGRDGMLLHPALDAGQLDDNAGPPGSKMRRDRIGERVGCGVFHVKQTGGCESRGIWTDGTWHHAGLDRLEAAGHHSLLTQGAYKRDAEMGFADVGPRPQDDDSHGPSITALMRLGVGNALPDS